MAYERFIDRPDNKKLIKECIGFSLRRHGLPPGWMTYFFIGVLLINIVIINELCISIIMMSPEQPIPLNRIIITLILVSILTTGAAIFAYSMVYKFREILIQSEFQNMMFSSTMAIDSEFAFIVNKKHNIVHYDYRFDHIFIGDSNQKASLDLFLSHDGFHKDSRTEMENAINNNTEVEIDFSLVKSDNSKQEMTIIIQPLGRPQGYSAIRAYKK